MFDDKCLSSLYNFAMFPTIFHFEGWGPIPEIILPAFFFLSMVGGLVCTFYLYFRAKKFGFSQVVILDLGMLGIAFGFIGARIFHVLFERIDFYIEDWTRIFEIWRGGFVSYGAYIGGALAVIIYLRLRKQSVLKYGDFIATGLPLVVFFVRLGCLGAGCCYGKPTDFFIHLVFDKMFVPEGQPNYAGMSLHATQLYAMTYASILFVFVNWLYFRKKFDGQVLLTFFMIYAVVRSGLEVLRGDSDRGVYFGGYVSTAQIVSACLVILCGVLYWYLARKKRLES